MCVDPHDPTTSDDLRRPPTFLPTQTWGFITPRTLGIHHPKPMTSWSPNRESTTGHREPPKTIPWCSGGMLLDLFPWLPFDTRALLPHQSPSPSVVGAVVVRLVRGRVGRCGSGGVTCTFPLRRILGGATRRADEPCPSSSTPAPT